jgi:S-adenosylmethionine decarboxylase
MPGAVCSFFEGTEKKFELVVDPALPSFRSLGDSFWTRIVRCAGADVLSKLSGEHCDAFVLSESSLFVFDHRVLMMTCGRTTLHDAVLALFEQVGVDRVRSLVYKRKHEVFPHDQPTSFFDDARVLAEQLRGRAFRLGNRDEHHLYVFHAQRDGAASPPCTTVEVFMHGLGEDVWQQFCKTDRTTTARVREATGLDRIIPGYDVDDRLFEPNGYSLNALRGHEYYAVHVTPEPGCSYASFETNRRFRNDLAPVLTRLLGIFRPRTWDVVLFDDGVDPQIEVPGYRLKWHVAQPADRSPGIRFLTYYRPQRTVAQAVELQVS